MRNHGKTLKRFFFVHQQTMFEMRTASTQVLSDFRKTVEASASDPTGEGPGGDHRQLEATAYHGEEGFH